MRIVVTRAFLIKGARQEPGSTLEVSDSFARALIHNGQAAAAPDAVVAQVGPMTTETAEDIVPGKRKGKAK